MKVSPSERHVQQLFKARYGIVLDKIDEHNGKGGRTSDFEYVLDGQRVFVCELKEFIDVPLTEEYGFSVDKLPSGVVRASKKHNATNRISDAIESGFAQLVKYPEPKILTILNRSRFMGLDDLEETYKGYRVLGIENGITHLDVYARRASEGKIKDMKKAIDLYIWIDTPRKEMPLSEDKVFFRTVSETGKRVRKEYFKNTVSVA